MATLNVPDAPLPTEGSTIYIADDGTPTSAAGPATNDPPDAGIEDLKKQLAQEKAAREASDRLVAEEREGRLRADNARRAAEARATSATGEVTAARTAEADAQYNAVVNALTAYEKQRDALKGQYAQLLEEGKFKEASDLNSEIAEVASRITTLKDGKQAAEDARKRASEARPADPPAPTQDESARQEAWLANQTPHNAAWIRQHRDRFFGDKAFSDRAIAASNYAVTVLGLRGGSPEYFQHVEEAVGLRQRPDGAPPQPHSSGGAAAPLPPPAASTAAAATPRSSPAPAAPPSRTAPNAAPGQPGGTPITLSPEERQIARMTFTPEICNVDPKTGIDPRTGRQFDPEVRFAMQKAELIREGKWESGRRY